MLSLLLAVGVVDRRGQRQVCWSVVQLGDLLDRQASVGTNLQTAQLAVETVDVVLVGNHECLENSLRYERAQARRMSTRG
jgi:hypothetical protein